MNDTLLYPNPADAKFQTYQCVDKTWEIEVRGFSFLGKTTETDYLSYAVIDSFARGIQIPKDEYFKFAVEMKKLFNDPNDEFYCEPFQCYFLDKSCKEESIVSKLTNFTIRFNDTFGFTIPPSVYLRDGALMAGN